MQPHVRATLDSMHEEIAKLLRPEQAARFRNHTGHSGPELKQFHNLQWSRSNLVIHVLGDSAAYVTADYSIRYQAGDRPVDSGGIATHVLIKEQGEWKIRHSHTAARRRAPGGTSVLG